MSARHAPDLRVAGPCSLPLACSPHAGDAPVKPGPAPLLVATSTGTGDQLTPAFERAILETRLLRAAFDAPADEPSRVGR